MKNNQEFNQSSVAIEIIDKMNLIKVDISFISNLLTAWDTEQTPTHNDMFGMSRVCDSVYNQLKDCEDLVNQFKEK